MISLILIILLSYLVGSIPTSIIFGKVLRGIDIRQHGSGNAGATNVYRIMGAKIALTVLMLDILKGILPVVFFAKIQLDSPVVSEIYVAILAGFAAVCGHVWTIFAKFKGGKGIGTSLGVFIVLLPLPSMISLLVWFIVMVATRYVSVASLSAGLALPISTTVLWYKGNMENVLLGFSFVIGTLFWITHISNIKRLLAGTEHRFGRNT